MPEPAGWPAPQLGFVTTVVGLPGAGAVRPESRWNIDAASASWSDPSEVGAASGIGMPAADGGTPSPAGRGNAADRVAALGEKAISADSASASSIRPAGVCSSGRLGPRRTCCATWVNSWARRAPPGPASRLPMCCGMTTPAGDVNPRAPIWRASAAAPTVRSTGTPDRSTPCRDPITVLTAMPSGGRSGAVSGLASAPGAPVSPDDSGAVDSNGAVRSAAAGRSAGATPRGSGASRSSGTIGSTIPAVIRRDGEERAAPGPSLLAAPTGPANGSGPPALPI